MKPTVADALNGDGAVALDEAALTERARAGDEQLTLLSGNSAVRILALQQKKRREIVKIFDQFQVLATEDLVADMTPFIEWSPSADGGETARMLQRVTDIVVQRQEFYPLLAEDRGHPLPNIAAQLAGLMQQLLETVVQYAERADYEDIEPRLKTVRMGMEARQQLKKAMQLAVPRLDSRPCALWTPPMAAAFLAELEFEQKTNALGAIKRVCDRHKVKEYYLPILKARAAMPVAVDAPIPAPTVAPESVPRSTYSSLPEPAAVSGEDDGSPHTNGKPRDQETSGKRRGRKKKTDDVAEDDIVNAELTDEELEDLCDDAAAARRELGRLIVQSAKLQECILAHSAYFIRAFVKNEIDPTVVQQPDLVKKMCSALRREPLSRHRRNEDAPLEHDFEVIVLAGIVERFLAEQYPAPDEPSRLIAEQHPRPNREGMSKESPEALAATVALLIRRMEEGDEAEYALMLGKRKTVKKRTVKTVSA